MSQYDDTNKGALFINHKREKDTHPNLRGQININGQEFWLSAWTKEIQQGQRQGEKMINLAVTPKEQQQGPQPTQQAAPEPDDLNDDIPW